MEGLHKGDIVACEGARPHGELELRRHLDQCGLGVGDHVGADRSRRQRVQGVGNCADLSDVDRAGTERRVDSGVLVDGRRQLHEGTRSRWVDEQARTQPCGRTREVMDGRDVAAVDLTDEVQFHGRDGLLQPMHAIEGSHQVGVGQGPGRRIGAFCRVDPEPLHHVQHHIIVEHTYDSFRALDMQVITCIT